MNIKNLLLLCTVVVTVSLPVAAPASACERDPRCSGENTSREIQDHISNISGFHDRLNSNKTARRAFNGMYVQVSGIVDSVDEDGTVRMRSFNDGTGLGGRISFKAFNVPDSYLPHIEEGRRVRAFGELSIKRFFGSFVSLKECRLMFL